MDKDSINNISKAVSSSADLGKEVNDSAQRLGSFIAPYTRGTFEELSGIIEDKLKYWRLSNQLKMFSKANEKLKVLGFDVPPARLPLKLILPILEHSSLEEEDSLQERWANLLVNSSIKTNEINMEMAYIDILKSLTSLEVEILSVIYSFNYVDHHENLSTLDLPYSVKGIEEDITISDDVIPDESIVIVLANLDRLGLINVTKAMSGASLYSSIKPTFIGEKFVQACTIQNIK